MAARRKIPVVAPNPFQQANEPDPLVSFEINQMVFVWIEDQPLTYIPCIPVSEEDMVSRIPHMSWIKYRGLARVNGDLFLRFIHDQAQVYVGLGFLKFLEDIPQREPGAKLVMPKGRARTVKQVKARGLRNRRKPGIRQKKVV